MFHLHSPSLSELVAYSTAYVTGASIAVNLLPKECVFDKYPRTQRAYRASVAILAVSALNLRKFIPSANLKIPGLGFEQYQRDHPELFAESVTQSVTVAETRTRVTGPADAAAATAASTLHPANPSTEEPPHA